MNQSARFDDNKSMNEGQMNQHQQSVLNAFDFSAIDEMDPSLQEGHHVVFDREAPFELRIQENSGPQEVGTLEAIRVKVL
jgi:hypothetical protein